MARIRVYIKPFNENGMYAANYIEVTDDVFEDGLSVLKQRLDNSDYDIGVYTNDVVNINLRNDHGRYNDVGEFGTMFYFKRADSLVKITWDRANFDYSPTGASPSGILHDEITVFEGLLNDDSSKMNVKDMKQSFAILGRESLFERVLAPFSSFSNGELASAIMLACLSQTAIQNVLTVSDPDINPALDTTVDDVSSLENKTVKEVLAEMLFITNSVLYINSSGTIIVTARTATATVQKAFYGQSSELGRENILAIEQIRNGINRLFNFITWAQTSLFSQNAATIAVYGYKKKEITSDTITNGTRKQTILDTLLTEFGSIKREFDLTTPISNEVLALPLLSRVTIDYPYALVSASDLPFYGIAQYGIAEYPKELLGFAVLEADPYKIMGRVVDLKKGEVKFSMRKI